MPHAQRGSKPKAALVVTVLIVGTWTSAVLRASRPTQWSGQPDQQVTEVTAFGQGAYTILTPHLTLPKLTHQVEPEYNRPVVGCPDPDAPRGRVEGDVAVELVVRADGTVGDARLAPTQPKNALHNYYYPTSGVGPKAQQYLQAEALNTVKDWTYKPGRLSGKLVPVVVTETVSFRTH